MWPRPHVIWLVVFVCLHWSVKAEEPNEELCAIKESVVAMKDLLDVLTDEVRELRKQVGQSCSAEGKPDAQTPDETTTSETDDAMTDDADSKEMEDGPSDLDTSPTEFPEVTLSTTTEDYDDENFTNPIDDVAETFQDWWSGFSLFDTQTTTPEPEAEDEDDYDDGDDIDYGYEPDRPTYPQQPPTYPQQPPTYPQQPPTYPGQQPPTYPQQPPTYPQQPPTYPQQPTYPQPPSTTQRPYGLPAVPSSCPDPFRLLGDGCFLIYDYERVYTTWGGAYEICEQYGGELAAPWRFESLRNFLNTYNYKSSFWVGARKMTHSQRWEWLSGRVVEANEWAPNKPTRVAGPYCVMLDSRAEYKASNYYCGEKYGFICEARQ